MTDLIRIDTTVIPQRIYTIKEILRAASYATTFRVSEIISHSRDAGLVRTRQAVMRLSKRLIPHYSLPFIGFHVGGRDHTTVLYALRLEGRKAAQADEIAACIELILDLGTIRTVPRVAPPQEPTVEAPPVVADDNSRLPPWMRSRLAQGMSPYHAARLARWQGYEWVSP